MNSGNGGRQCGRSVAIGLANVAVGVLKPKTEDVTSLVESLIGSSSLPPAPPQFRLRPQVPVKSVNLRVNVKRKESPWDCTSQKKRRLNISSNMWDAVKFLKLDKPANKSYLIKPIRSKIRVEPPQSAKPILAAEAPTQLSVKKATTDLKGNQPLRRVIDRDKMSDIQKHLFEVARKVTVSSNNANRRLPSIRCQRKSSKNFLPGRSSVVATTCASTISNSFNNSNQTGTLSNLVKTGMTKESDWSWDGTITKTKVCPKLKTGTKNQAVESGSSSTKLIGHSLPVTPAKGCSGVRRLKQKQKRRQNIAVADPSRKVAGMVESMLSSVVSKVLVLNTIPTPASVTTRNVAGSLLQTACSNLISYQKPKPKILKTKRRSNFDASSDEDELSADGDTPPWEVEPNNDYQDFCDASNVKVEVVTEGDDEEQCYEIATPSKYFDENDDGSVEDPLADSGAEYIKVKTEDEEFCDLATEGKDYRKDTSVLEVANIVVKIEVKEEPASDLIIANVRSVAK